MARFTDDEVRRYSRQILLREVGGRGQERLRAAEVHIQGSGLVAEVTATYLQRAGIGKLTVEPATDPGITLVRTQGAQLFATTGPTGGVGWGSPSADAVRLPLPLAGVGAPPVDSRMRIDGGGWGEGSALALETLKLLLGLA